MSAMPNNAVFASAYRQLNSIERTFVDAAVTEFERIAYQNSERIALALTRPIPPQIMDRSRGMLDKPMVTAAIAERVNEISASNDLTVPRMIKEMMSVGLATMGDYIRFEDVPDHVNGGFMTVPILDITACTPEMMSAIKSIEIEESGDGLSRPAKRKIKLVLHDKLGAMKMLGEMMGMLASDNPYWRAETARATPPTLPAGASAQQAGEAYAAMIDG